MLVYSRGGDNLVDMLIGKDQIKTSKRIGTLDGEPVIGIETKGGFHLVVGLKRGKPTIFSTGPHRGVAHFSALKAEKNMRLMELSKSEQLDPRSLQSIEPKYQAITNALNQALNRYLQGK